MRNNVHPVLAGEGAECLINGLFIGDGRQHLDNYMLVEHVSPHCSSRQFYNGILDEQAHGVFHGRIIVHKDAQKTDAKQTNRNLLLSDDARIDTKPQLEIHADDVKCTHGATIGQIDEDALFYLRSRGFNEISARRLLLYAFAGECLDRMQPGPGRNIVERLDSAAPGRYSAGDPLPGRANITRSISTELGGGRMTTLHAKHAARQRTRIRCGLERTRTISRFLRASQRQETGLPRQCRHIAETRGRNRRNCPATTGTRTPTSIVAYITSPNRRRKHMKLRAQAVQGFLNAATAAKLFLFAAQPKQSIWWPTPMAELM